MVYYNILGIFVIRGVGGFIIRGRGLTLACCFQGCLEFRVWGLGLGVCGLLKGFESLLVMNTGTVSGAMLTSDYSNMCHFCSMQAGIEAESKKILGPSSLSCNPV